MKFTLYEGGVRGAALIFSPLIKNNSRVSKGKIHMVDWLPTLYAAAGGTLTDLKNIDGLNQWDSIKYAKKSPRNSMLLNIDETAGLEGAIVGKYKLIKGT